MSYPQETHIMNSTIETDYIIAEYLGLREHNHSGDNLASILYDQFSKKFGRYPTEEEYKVCFNYHFYCFILLFEALGANLIPGSFPVPRRGPTAAQPQPKPFVSASPDIHPPSAYPSSTSSKTTSFQASSSTFSAESTPGLCH